MFIVLVHNRFQRFAQDVSHNMGGKPTFHSKSFQEFLTKRKHQNPSCAEMVASWVAMAALATFWMGVDIWVERDVGYNIVANVRHLVANLHRNTINKLTYF